MTNLVYNLGKCIQAHESRRTRIHRDRLIVQSAKPENTWSTALRTPEVNQTASLMSFIWPEAHKNEALARPINGDSIVKSNHRAVPTRTHVDMAMRHLAREEQVLSQEPVTFVSEEICELLNVAVSKMGADTLRPTDLTAPQGFLYLAKPIYLPDFHPETGEYDERLKCGVRAICWQTEEHIGTTINGGTWGRGVVMWLYMDGGLHKAVTEPGLRMIYESEGKTYSPKTTALGDTHLLPIDQHAWAFDSPWEEAPDLTAVGLQTRETTLVVPSPVAEMRKWFLAFMRFCWQEIIVPRPATNSDLPRNQRRAFERNSQAENPINIVYLRRVVERGDDSSVEGQGLAFRVLVRGHWRNQYYPSLGPVEDPSSHRRIWIDPHVKGPENAPFKETVKVTAVVR